jgi:hypothetical protein
MLQLLDSRENIKGWPEHPMALDIVINPRIDDIGAN